MNWTHLHLALNHVPVLGVPLLTLLLGWGWLFRSRDIQRVALLWLALLSAVAIAIKFTGDNAAEVDPQRFVAVKAYLNQHEQSADQATTAVFVLGLAAATGVFLGRGTRPVPKWILGIVLGLGVVAAVLFGRTANLGGQILHPSIRPHPTVKLDGGKGTSSVKSVASVGSPQLSRMTRREGRLPAGSLRPVVCIAGREAISRVPRKSGR